MKKIAIVGLVLALLAYGWYRINRQADEYFSSLWE